MEMMADKVCRERPGSSGCPGEEFLARFSAGELPDDTPEARHIAHCPECRRKLDALAEAVRLWERRMSEPCDAAVLERIKEGFHRKLHETDPGI